MARRMDGSCGLLAAMTLISLATPLSVAAEMHFVESVEADTAPSDYVTLVSFQTPSGGTGVDRKTIVRFVVDFTAADLFLQIDPDPPDRVPADDVRPLSGGGASKVVEDDITDTIMATVFADILTDSVALDHQMVRVTIGYEDDYNFSSAETWHLKVKEMTSDLEYFGWAADTDALATKEAFEVPDSIDFGDVFFEIDTDFSPVVGLSVRNVGTARMTVGAKPIEGENPQDFDFEPDNVIDLLPGESLVNDYENNQGVWLTVSPKELGTREATVTLVSTDAASEEIELSAVGVNLFAHILVDCSGSMSWDAEANRSVPYEDQRLYALKEAGQEINNWIRDFSDEKAWIGLSTFPDCTDSAIAHVPVPIQQDFHAAINVQMGHSSSSDLVASGGTPMQDGIVATKQNMDLTLAEASDDPELLMQAILLMSDGAESASSDARSETDDLLSLGIRVFTVGYGVEGAADVDHDLLWHLADDTDGEWLGEANTLDAFALKNAFKEAMLAWMGMEPIVDPVHAIRRGQTNTHTTCVEEDAYGLSFSVDWDRRAPGGIDIAVRTPFGDTVLSSDPGVSFHSSDTFAMFNIRGDLVRGGNGAGEWTLQVTGDDGIPSSEDTNYSYNVLAQTPVHTEPLGLSALLTAHEALVQILVDGWPADLLPRTVVTATVDVPGESFGTYLATHDVNPEWFFDLDGSDAGGGRPTAGNDDPTGTAKTRVPELLLGEPAGIVQRKAWALANIAGTPFTNQRRTGELSFYDDGTHGDPTAGDGVFSARAGELAYEGTYRYAVQVSILDAGRQDCINRQFPMVNRVLVSLDAGYIAENVKWQSVERDLFFDPNVAQRMVEPAKPGQVRSAAVLTPRDTLGNYWGPGKARLITYEAIDSEAVGVVDNWDGSYLLIVEHAEGVTPRVRINVDGVQTEMIPSKPERPLWWVWALVLLAIVALVVWLVRR